MCGIAGIIGAHAVADVQTMIDTLVHRGPDDQGVQSFTNLPNLGCAVLGHRRLAIIDLSAAGHQPMANEDGTVWVVYNGEIYNFAELRIQLEKCGHRFKSRSDTEVILHGYEEWGSACVERFNGMFAFALLDSHKGELFLVRDRFGVKPVYYTEVNGRFAFASEAKALLELDGVRRGIDAEALELYLALGYVPWPRALFAGVRKVPPGHLLRLRGGRPELHEYWRLPAPEPVNESFEDQLAEFRRLLESAVESRMVSDVPVGSLLSGGLDSSVVTALMRKVQGRAQRLDTFCVGYESSESRHHEQPYARVVADHLGTEHHEVTCSNEWAINSLPRLIWHMDEPITDDTIPPYARVCERARQDVTVALSGQGADEFIYGYRYYCLEKVRRGLGLAPRSLRGVGRRLIERYGDPESLRAKALFCALSDTPLDLFIEWGVCFSPHERRALAGSTSGISAGAGDELLRSVLKPSRCNGVDVAPHLDARYRLVDYVFNQTDKLSMAASLEVREPLMDHRLIEFLARVPESRKIRGFQGKYLLRRAVEDLLPPEIVWRRKKPFGSPVEVWLGPLSDHYLRQSRLVRDGIINAEPLQRLLGAPLRGGAMTNRMWALTALEVWYRVFIEREHAAPEPVMSGGIQA